MWLLRRWLRIRSTSVRDVNVVRGPYTALLGPAFAFLDIATVDTPRNTEGDGIKYGGRTGLGYQTGYTPWWSWVKGRRPPRRVFEPRGLYRVLRHPVYLSFLGLVWITPAMTLDRAVLTAVWTAYIFLGSYWKDRRLLHYIGEPYRRYQATVAGYPFIPAGPLATARDRPQPPPCS